MKKFHIISSAIILSASVLTGCSEGSRTYTVADFMADETLLERIRSECRNNPGELQETPNCMNASEAKRKIVNQKQRERFSSGMDAGK